MKIKTRLVMPLLILMPLAACQSEQPSTSTAPASQQASSAPSSTVAVTKEAVETRAKDLQANIAQQKEVATKAAAQLTESVKEKAKAAEEAATKAAETAKAAAAKAAETAKAAAAKAAETAKAAAAKAAEKAKAAAATKAAETAKATATTKAAESVKIPAATMAASLLSAKPQMAATGDATKGKSLANKCKGCHNFTAKKKVGPGLQGVVGRKSGAMAGMKYSTALAAGDWVWNEKNLAIWLCDSKAAVKTLSGNASAKTKMGAQRICDATKQADLIAFLKTL